MANQQKFLIRVLSMDESRLWHQPASVLREWYQRKEVARVEDVARTRGCHTAFIFDAQEDLQWQGRAAKRQGK